MPKVAVFIAEGCEEIEALTVVDILRRAGIDTQMLSITDKAEVTGSHGIRFQTDQLFSEADFSDADGVVLPGGMPGTLNLKAHAGVQETIRQFRENGRLLCAICAAPTVPGEAGLLKGLRATCYPGNEEKLLGAEVVTDQPVVHDQNVITSRGMGTAIPFALEIVAAFLGKDRAEELKKAIVF